MRTIEEITAEINQAKRMNSCGLHYKEFVNSSYYKGLLEELDVATSVAELHDSIKATDVSAVGNPHEARCLALRLLETGLGHLDLTPAQLKAVFDKALFTINFKTTGRNVA